MLISIPGGKGLTKIYVEGNGLKIYHRLFGRKRLNNQFRTGRQRVKIYAEGNGL